MILKSSNPNVKPNFSHFKGLIFFGVHATLNLIIGWKMDPSIEDNFPIKNGGIFPPAMLGTTRGEI